MKLEHPIPLLSRPVNNAQAGTVTRNNSLRYVDPSDYDDAEFFFEIVYENADAEAHDVLLVDFGGSTIATIEGSVTGANINVHKRTASPVTLPGADIYGVQLTGGGTQFLLREARIWVRQGEAATKTLLHFPFVTNFNNGSDGPTGTSTSTTYTLGGSPSTIRAWQKVRERFEADAVSWEWEGVGRCAFSGETRIWFAGLFNRTTNELVAEVSGTSNVASVQRIAVADNETHFDDLDFFELRFKHQNGGNAQIHSAVLKARLEGDLQLAWVELGIAKSTSYSGQRSDQRVLYDPTRYGEHELYVLVDGDPGSNTFHFLGRLSANADGSSPATISGSQTPDFETGTGRQTQQSAAFSTDGGYLHILPQRTAGIGSLTGTYAWFGVLINGGGEPITDTVRLQDRVAAALRERFGGRFDAEYGFADSLSGELSENLEGEFSDAFGFTDDVDGSLTPNLSAEMSDAFGFTDSVAASGGSIDGDLADMRSPNLVAPLTITPRSGDPIHVAPQAIRHPDRFYESRIRTFGIFSRSVPAPSGIVRLSDASAEIIDTGSDLRERFAPKTMRKARVELRIGPEGGSYSAFLRPMLREIADVRFRDGIIIPEFRDVAFDFFKEEVDPFITRENFPNLPENPQSQFGNIIVGVVHSALGAILCPLVDPVSGLYLAARHLLPSVDEVFRKRREDEEAVPFSGFTVVEQEVNGHLRTFLQIPNQELDTLIFANITGVDLRRPSQQVREILLTARDLTGRINFASFEETLAKEVALGYFSDGAFTEPITFGEAATQILRSFQEDLYTDIFDRLSINLTTGDDVPEMAFDDVLHHHEGTVNQTLAEPTYNVIPYRYGRDYARRKWHQETEFVNDVDVDAIGERVKAPEINMWFVRDDITARAVAEDYASYYDLDAFRIHGEIPLVPTVERIEPTDLVEITHFGGISPFPGYRREVFKITDLDMDIPRLKYRYKAIRRVQFEGAIGFLAGTTAHNSRFGPFLPSAGFGGDGRMYSILRDPDDEKILRAWGTRDWGATWVMLDADNSPAFENTIASYDAHFNDSFKPPPLGSPGHIPGQLDEILCACQEGVTARVSYSRFDLRSERWVVSNRHVFTPDPTPIGAQPPFPLYVSISRIRVSPYTQAIFFDGAPQTVADQLVRRGMVALSFDSGGNWSVPVYVAERLSDTGIGGEAYNYKGGRAIAGAGGFLHFFYQRHPGDFVRSTPDMVVRTMDLAGLSGTPSTVQIQSRLGAERKWWETNLVVFPAQLNVGNYQTYTYDFDEEGNELPAHTGQRHILLPVKGSSGRPMLFNFVSRPEIVFADAHRGLAEGVEHQNLAFGNVSEDIATGLGDTLNPSIVARLFPTRSEEQFRTMRAVMSIVGNPSWTVYKERRHSPTDTDQNALLPSSGTWFPSIDGTCQLDTSPPENVPCARLFKAGPTRPFSTAEVRRVGAEFITGVLPRPSEVWMATMQFVRQWDAAEAVIGRSTNFWIFEMLKVHGKEEDIPLPEDPQWTIDRWLHCLTDERKPHACRFDIE